MLLYLRLNLHRYHIPSPEHPFLDLQMRRSGPDYASDIEIGREIQQYGLSYVNVPIWIERMEPREYQA